jgi:putative DNA primase/helicase
MSNAASRLVPNYQMAELHLKLIAPRVEFFTFQTYSDSPENREGHKAQGIRDPLARILHGSLAQHWDELVRFSAAGAGIYVTVNETDFRGRSAANIVHIRAHFCDLDGAPLANFRRIRLSPHFYTETSPGRYHVCWRVAEATLGQFKSVQQRLAVLMDGDPSVCDVSRVMRLAGFAHQKEPAQPFLVTVAAPAVIGPAYSAADFQAALAEGEAIFATTDHKQHDQTDSSSPPDMEQGYSNGHRTRELTRRAGWCLGPWKMTEDQAVTACLEWNKFNTPPLPEEKVRSTVANIAKAEKKKRQGTNSHQQQGRADERRRDSDQAALIDELARLDSISYDRRREKAAEQLGIRVTTLDEEVKRRRAKRAGEAEEPPLFAHWADQPWPEPVDGDALILALVRRVRSHVVMSAEAALTVALWIIFTWVHAEAAIHSPILIVTSPEAECGKTTLLSLIGFLVRRALQSVGISPAALYRSIEKWAPTLITDEADVAFVQNDDLRAVVNSGWTRGQGVLRCEGDEHEPRLFPTFCPKAIGLKGKKLPDTTASRAIIIELKRKLANEQIEDFRHTDDRGLQELRQQLLRWSVDNASTLRNASPSLPDGFANRVAANWHLLLAIAEAAGDEWAERARAAAAVIAKAKATLDASIGIQLLTDIRTGFGDKDCLFSRMLIAILTDDPERPWAEYSRGKPLTQKQLANRLRAYGIVSDTVWIGNESAKGYKRAAFEDVWRRYLSE